MVGGVWNGFLLGQVRGEVVPCRFCGGTDGDGHPCWECPYPPLVEIRENPEFHDLMRMDKSHWSRCLLWHGWLPLLSGTVGESPWAVGTDDAAVYMLLHSGMKRERLGSEFTARRKYVKVVKSLPQNMYPLWNEAAHASLKYDVLHRQHSNTKGLKDTRAKAKSNFPGANGD